MEGHLRDARSEPTSDVDALIDDISEIRRDLDDLADGLRPRLLGELGLAGALEALVGRSAVPVTRRIRLDAEPDPAVAAGLLFVAAESLTNVARHAGASHVSVDLDAGAAGIRLEIADDGRGGADPTRGSGLAGLRERVEALGGCLSVGERQPTGTRVVVQLPSRPDRRPLPGAGG